MHTWRRWAGTGIIHTSQRPEWYHLLYRFASGLFGGLLQGNAFVVSSCEESFLYLLHMDSSYCRRCNPVFMRCRPVCSCNPGLSKQFFNFFDYHHPSATGDKIIAAIISNRIQPRFCLISGQFIFPKKAMVSLISSKPACSGDQVIFSFWSVLPRSHAG